MCGQKRLGVGVALLALSACSAEVSSTMSSSSPALGPGVPVTAGGQPVADGVSPPPAVTSGQDPAEPEPDQAGTQAGTALPDFDRDATAGSGLSAAVLDALRAGGSSCSIQLLYPYEGTTMPGGLPSPTLMWSGASDAAHVKLRYALSESVRYEYAVGPSDPGELRIPQEDWEEITRRASTGPLLITHTVKRGSTLSSCETRLRIAPGNMVGALFYNTYNHPDANGQGAVMRLQLGQESPEVYLKYGGVSAPLTGPCISCHSVSFDGSTLVATNHDYLSKTWSTARYDVSAGVAPGASTDLDNATWGALTPDGTHMLTVGNPDCTAGADTFPRSSNNMPLVEGPDTARLLDTGSGREMNTSGLQRDWYMWMAQFSPNGDRVVFNHAKPDGAGGTDRRELAVMDYDPVSHAFTSPTVLVSDLGPAPSIPYSPAGAFAGALLAGKDNCTEGGQLALPIPGLPGDTAPLDRGTCSGPCYPAWPFFTPDGRGVIFSLISQPDFAYALPGRDEPSASELWYVDTETLEAVPLANANRGLAAADGWSNYYPTVLPVAVGGYYWVFWTSTRSWGHRDPDTGGAVALAPPGTPGLSQSYLEAVKKRIWVAAIRPRITGTEFASEVLEDPSLPPFYLEGQSATGNVRSFAALNPCVATAESCESGLDCCSGYCSIAPGERTGSCVDEPPMCSDLNERCDEDGDCCEPGPEDADQTQRYCLGGFCGFVSLI